MSREAYCRAVLDVLAAEQKRHQQQHLAKGVNSNTGIHSSSDGPIMVRLLLAIDRRRLEDMEDTVQLLLKLREVALLLLPRPWKGKFSREKKSSVLMPIRIRILTQVLHIFGNQNFFTFIHRKVSVIGVIIFRFFTVF
jgi:hypothetical protein